MLCASVQPSEGSMASTFWLFNLCLPTGKSSRAAGTLPVNFTLSFLLPPRHPVNSNHIPGRQPGSTHKSTNSRNANFFLPTSLYAEAPYAKAVLLQLPGDTGRTHPLNSHNWRTMNLGHRWPLKSVDDRFHTKHHVKSVISGKRPTA